MIAEGGDLMDIKDLLVFTTVAEEKKHFKSCQKLKLRAVECDDANSAIRSGAGHKALPTQR